LRLKSNTFDALSSFFAYVTTQFGHSIKHLQCNNGREFDNSFTRSFLLACGTLLRMPCPYTTPRNGKVERIVRTTNNIIRSLLFQASLPAQYWIEGLHTATYRLNRLPTKTIQAIYPYVALFGTIPSYDHLQVFGCACYNNITSTAPHKLAPRSTKCVFLRYSSNHKGYHCLDLSTNSIIISHHVTFDEADFPFSASPHLTTWIFWILRMRLCPVPLGLCPFLQVPWRPLWCLVQVDPVAHLTRPMPLMPVTASAPHAPSLPSPDWDLVPSATSPTLPSAPGGLALAPGAAPTPLVLPSVPGGLAPAPGAAPTPQPLRVYTRRRQQTTSPIDLPVAGVPAAGASSASLLLTEFAPIPSPTLGLPLCAIPTPVVVNDHPMTTQAKVGFRVPAAFTATAISPEPTSVRQGLADCSIPKIPI
jgi:hypothetical protein